MEHPIIIFGPPGSGKGTQALLLAKKLDLAHLSTGELLREAVKNKTELGKKVEEIMLRGALVPDELVIALVKEFVKKYAGKKNFILDGFPRTVKQAQMLDTIFEETGIERSVVVNLTVDEEELIERLVKRSQKEGRADDNEETIRNRLTVYNRDTAPVLDYYREKDYVADVNGMGSIDEIHENILSVL